MSRSCATIASNTFGASLSSMNSFVSPLSAFFVAACFTPFSVSTSKYFLCRRFTFFRRAATSSGSGPVSTAVSSSSLSGSASCSTGSAARAFGSAICSFGSMKPVIRSCRRVSPRWIAS